MALTHKNRLSISLLLLTLNFLISAPARAESPETPSAKITPTIALSCTPMQTGGHALTATATFSEEDIQTASLLEFAENIFSDGTLAYCQETVTRLEESGLEDPLSLELAARTEGSRFDLCLQQEGIPCKDGVILFSLSTDAAADEIFASLIPGESTQRGDIQLRTSALPFKFPSQSLSGTILFLIKGIH